MKRLLSKRTLVIVAVAYALIWYGGNLSFAYTHECVRSHKEMVYNRTTDDEQEVTVCDFYSANGKRWTFLDAARSFYSVNF